MTIDARELTPSLAVPIPRRPVDLVPAMPVRRRHRWQVTYAGGLVALDAVALLAAGCVAVLFRFGGEGAQVQGGPSYWIVLLLAVPLWLATIALSGAYGLPVIGSGRDEYKRTLDAGLRFSAVIVTLSYVTHAELARLLLVVWLPLTVVTALCLRCLARHQLARARLQGHAMKRVIVIGDESSAFSLAARLDRARGQGFQVIGVCAPGGLDRRQVRGAPISADRRRPAHRPTVVGRINDTARLVRELDADVIAVAPASAMSAERLRRLAWEVEGTGVEMLVAPALVDVAGPRLHVSPIDGQPLVHVQTPLLRGTRAFIKSSFDRVVALMLLLAALPLLATAAVLVARSGRGPLFFRQVRVGRGGKPFTILKLRTMRVGAEAELRGLWSHNDHVDGPLFKMENDPRVTPIGRHLRRWSIDELPQLLNVLFGHMSLVGPRPPLPSEVDRYDHSDIYRRLMVKPGLTGLWQVSGRSDLGWSEAVRLDLYYVENWSLTLDVSILCKTVGAVLRGGGAR